MAQTPAALLALLLAVVGVAVLVAMVFVRRAFRTSGSQECSLCRARSRCVPGNANECCCPKVDADGCWYGEGLCADGLVCQQDMTPTGTCRPSTEKLTDDTSSNKHCTASLAFGDCRAEAVGDCGCLSGGGEAEEPKLACTSDAVSNVIDPKYTASTQGICWSSKALPPKK
jgi:hypothetical protein